MKKFVTIAFIVAAATPALAQTNDAFVVTGKDWMNSSSQERAAFLKGVANMIMAEGAYAKHFNQPMPPVSAQIVKAADTVKPADFESRITRWYEANPTKWSTPVMTVVWRDIVKKQP